MDTLLKISIIIALLGISLQDIKERKVFLFLFVVTGILMSFLHLNKVLTNQFITSSLINCMILAVIILVLYIYSKFLLKKTLKETFGLGDFIFFLILALGFPTLTFLILFSFSLMFSITLHLILKTRKEYKTVPLAGFQSLFVCIIFITNWIFSFTNLYIL